MKQPVISVLMPVYNCKKYVRESVYSVLNQTFKDLELIVIDDCSTDNTVSIIEHISDSRLKLIKKQKNSGIANSLNLGLKIAKGKYVARMDADDISLPNRLESQIAFMESETSVMLCASNHKVIPTNETSDRPSNWEDIKIKLLSSNIICHPSVVIRQEFLLKHNLLYDARFEPAEDYELWTRIIELGRVHIIPEVLLHYRLHEGQVSHTRSVIQLEMATRCRKLMLRHLTEGFDEHDHRILDKILKNERFEHIGELRKAFSVLDGLVDQNRKKNSYDNIKFCDYTESLKRMLVRSYFIFRDRFDLGILRSFLSMKREKSFLSKIEQISLAAKCMVNKSE